MAGDVGRAKSFHLLQQLPRVSQQVLNPFALADRVPSEPAVLERIPVSLVPAGFSRTAVHAAAPFAAHRNRAEESVAGQDAMRVAD